MNPHELEVGTLFKRTGRNRIYGVISLAIGNRGFKIRYVVHNLRQSSIYTMYQQTMHLYEIVPAPLNAENLRKGYQV